MFDPRTIAARDGITIEVADLGAWNCTLLVAEYDAAARTIRVNERALEAYRRTRGELRSCDVSAFIDRAVAHELYHHREAVGEVARLPTLGQREAAAEAYAREYVPIDTGLEAFLRVAGPL